MRGSEIHAGSRRDVGRNVFDVSAIAQACPGVGLTEGPMRPRRVSMSDLDPLETRERLDALNSVVMFERRSADVPARRTAQWRPPQRRAGMVLSQYLLSEHVPPVRETPHHGDQEIEYKIRSLIRRKSDPVGRIHRS
jgi:hypothetical protein